MNLKQALKKIKELEQNVALLKQDNATLVSDKETLQEENEAQRQLIFEQQEKINELMASQTVLREKYQIAQTKPFVKKSEKLGEITINEPEDILKKAKQKDKKPRGRKKGGKNFANIDLEAATTNIIYEDPDSCTCPLCSRAMTPATENARYVIEVIPETMRVTKIITRSLTCKHDGSFRYPLSKEVFPGSVLTPSFAAYITYHKYELGIPFHHLERHIFETLKINISKQLMASWMKNLALKIAPIHEQMKADLLANSVKVIHVDETTLSVAKRPEYAKNRKLSYVYVYATSYYDKQIHIYDFHESREIDRTATWMKDYSGYLICDDYKGYDKLARENPNVKLQRCWAHARRKFADIIKGLGDHKNIQKTASYQILTLINSLFAFEKVYKKEKLLASEILARRTKDQQKILDQLHVFIFDTPLKKGTVFADAVLYIRKIWEELKTYLTYPYLELSNNLAERAVKPFVINRKMFMTAGSYAGARYTTIIFSLVRTALINQLDIQKYIIYVLNNLEKVPVEDLVPYSTKLPSSLKI